MNQIAIGDDIAGYTVLGGASVQPPNFKAIPYFNFSSLPTIQENLEIQLKGTSEQINTFLRVLSLIMLRADLYEKAAYAAPQFLRFQKTAQGSYYYTPITQLSFSSNPAGFMTQSTGSRVITLTYTRRNYFDGQQVQLPLTRDTITQNPPASIQVHNCTDFNEKCSSLLIDKKDFSTVLPAPLRIQFEFSTSGTNTLTDLYIGIYNHSSTISFAPFFYHAGHFSGGTSTNSIQAITGEYKSFTWTSGTWQDITGFSIPVSHTKLLSGFSYRPFLRSFSAHAYTDLYLRFKIRRLSTDLFVSEPVYAPAGYNYVILPPAEIPPALLLGEGDPAELSFQLQGFRVSGAQSTLTLDCITLFPVFYSASFFAFLAMQRGHILIDDNHLGRHSLTMDYPKDETISHTRLGGPLCLFPGHHSRIFFNFIGGNHLLNLTDAGYLKIYYRPRYLVL